MTPAQAVQSLRVIQSNLRSILAGNAQRVLAEAIEGISVTASRSRQGLKRNPKEHYPWGYFIAPDNPLEFLDCKINGLNCRVDLSCKIFWQISSGSCVEQNIILRIWSLDKSMCYRSNWDSSNVDAALGNNPRRVMLRYHFDLANDKQPGPRYHLQVGGLAQDNELCWFPDALNLPRVSFPPSDLVLACEMVAANFFPDDYRRIRSDPTWRGVVRMAEQLFYKEYYQRCYTVLSSGQNSVSLIDELWNVEW